jgi:hypothetical protein
MVFIGKQVIEKSTKSITFRVALGGNGESKQHIQPYWQAHSHLHQEISFKIRQKFSLIGILKIGRGIRI